MSTLLNIIKLIAIMVAAALLGNWFLAEARKGRSQGKPWYQAYYSVPGILIILALLILPIVVWIGKK